MLDFLQKYQRRKERQKICLGLDEEIKKNLEAYYVMFQLGKLRFFVMEAWQQVQQRDDLLCTAPVLRYGQVLDLYNTTLKDFKDYEGWYSSDVNNKSKENGRILHAKNAEAKKKFEGLEDVIKAAQEGWSSFLTEEGIRK